MDHAHVIGGPKGETFDATTDELHALTKFVPDPAGVRRQSWASQCFVRFRDFLRILYSVMTPYNHSTIITIN